MDSVAKSAFSAHLDHLETSSETALLVSELGGAGIAAVMASPVQRDAVAGRLAAFTAARGAHLLHGGPGQWLAIAEMPGRSWIEDVAEVVDGAAQVFDQSAGYALLALRGDHALSLLQKGLFVDLDKLLDRDGASLNSVVAHVSVSVWRMASDLFGVAVPRSYAGSFWHWFEAAAAAEAIRPSRTR